MPEQFTIPRGMKDIEPSEMARRLWLTDKVRQVLWTYGFQMVETSPLENLETLEARSGPEIREQIYWFKDKAGRDLGLRFDLTVGLTRLVANRFDLPEPIKVASVGGNWRYEEPQFGRYRHFAQWDAEIYGVEAPVADAEIVAVGSDILTAVGLLDHEVRLSNRKLIEGFLRSLEKRTDSEFAQLMRIVDKLDKIGSGRGEKELLGAGLSKESVARVLDFVSWGGKPDDALDNIQKRLPKGEMIEKGFTELSGTIEAVEDLGMLGKCRVDLGIVRGIGYYDGMVFEAYDRDGESLGSIFGGGRFDKLCRTYGKRDMPATGVAGGIERLMLSLERKQLFPELEQGPKVFVATVNETVRREAVGFAQNLRNRGLWTDYDLKQRSLPKQLEYANSIKAKVVLIVGRRELEQSKVRVKDLRSGSEKDVAVAGLVDEVAAMVR